MEVFIGLGSNLGDKVFNIKLALELLEKSVDVQIKQVASLYETEPVGIKDQPWFVNTAAKLETNLDPEELYRLCKRIEKRMKRKDGPKWGPRLIDLDILLYEQQIIKTETLKIPHPQLDKRKFVLVPLVELDENLIHPQLNKTLVEILDNLGENEEKVIKLKETKVF